MSKSWPHCNERQNSCHLSGALVIQSPCSQQLLYGLTPSCFTWWILPSSRCRGAPATSVWSEDGQGWHGLQQDAPLSQAFSAQLPCIVLKQAIRVGLGTIFWVVGFLVVCLFVGVFVVFLETTEPEQNYFLPYKLSGLAKCSVRADLHITTWGWLPASSNEALGHHCLP